MGEVSRLLALQVDPLVAELFPAAKRVGHEWCVGSLAGESGNSLAIHIGGAKSGVWADFSAGQRGDALELIALALYGGDRLKALAWALAWLGLEGNTPLPARLAAVTVRQVRQVQQEPERQADEACKRILAECTAIAGSLGEIYLTHRGVRPPADDYDSVLRFHHSCWFGKERLPALIAVMTDPITNQMTGIHRTALAPDGRGKANIDAPKMMLGKTGVVRLTADENVTNGLGICEGIETGLAIIQRAGWAPIWSATSAGGIASFPVLAGIESLTIFADHDAVNRFGRQPGIDAARQCAARWHASGRAVHIKKPPLGMDWDDALKVAA